MRHSYLSFFSILLFIAVSCQNDVITPLELTKSNKETSLVLPLEKIPVDKVVLSEKDAVLVANLFINSELSTKSFSSKQIKDVVPINDTEGNPAIYAVNFTDGYILVSATKNYYPILAEVEHGSFNLQTNTGQVVIVEELLQNIECIKLDSTSKVNRLHWRKYEEKSNKQLITTKVNDPYYNVLDRYWDYWHEDDREVYFLYEQPSNMPDELYEEFCEKARDDMGDSDGYPYMECAIITEKFVEFSDQKGPLIQSLWGQKSPYNSYIGENNALGCVTIAVGQLMRYFQHPAYYGWSLMPDDTSSVTLNSFLASLCTELGAEDDGGSTIYRAQSVMEDYGYDCSIISHQSSSVFQSLSNNKPVYMRGQHTIDPQYRHAWVCDGYRYTESYCEYKLYILSFYMGEPSDFEEWASERCYDDYPVFFHMNWGWDGVNNGYYLDTHINVNLIQGPRNYANNRKDLIINRIL